MKQKIGTVLKTCFALLALNAVPFLSASPFFSGYAGIKTDLSSNESSSSLDPEMTTQSFFAGQLDFSKSFLIRTEISVETDDILAKGLMNDTDATFRIDELSATYRKQLLGTSQYFSLFLGTSESIGSDTFLQRQFGIKPISSRITESWLGLNGSSVYPFYGAGGSYIIHFDRAPIATGLYVYENKENDDNDSEVNTDLRFATVMQYLTFDVACGLGTPLKKKDGDTDVLLLIDTIYLHAGLNLLVGNAYTSSLFVQCGFRDLPVRAGEDSSQLDADDIYLLFEPRIITRDFQLHITMFSFPQETADDLLFITDPFGFNVDIFTNNLYIRNTNITFGFNVTCSFPDKNFMDITEIPNLIQEQGSYTVRVSPFLALPIMSGTLHTMLQVTATDFSKTSLFSAFKLNVGYRVQL